MDWANTSLPLYATIVAIGALVSTRKIVVAWLQRGRPLSGAADAAMLARLDELRGQLTALQGDVVALSDELAATRTEFRALARSAAPSALPAPPHGVGQLGTPAVDSADHASSTLSS